MEPLNSQLINKIGIDIVYMPRYKKFLKNENFISKIMTQYEQDMYRTLNTDNRRLEFLCGRYACKEAYAKAKGTGIGLIDFKDFEVLVYDSGQPYAKGCEISISHDGDYTIAMVLVKNEISDLKNNDG